MKKIYLQIFIISTISLFSFSINAQKLNNYVTDNANIIPDNEQVLLENKLSQFSASTTNQIVILTIENLPENETIESYTYKIFQENQIGQKDKNNGLLFLIAVNDRQNRFEIGYGLEPIIPDVYTGRLQRDVIAPSFRNGDYIGAINTSIDQIIEKINKAEPFIDTENKNYDFDLNSDIVSFIIFFFIIFLQILINIFSKSKSYWAGGVVGFILGLIIYLITGFALAFILIIFGLLLDMIVSKNPNFFKNNGRGYGGFGGFGGGRSGGGFLGGGGFSGGGGSSGRW